MAVAALTQAGRLKLSLAATGSASGTGSTVLLRSSSSTFVCVAASLRRRSRRVYFNDSEFAKCAQLEPMYSHCSGYYYTWPGLTRALETATRAPFARSLVLL